ncbi:MAG: hypothetical protein A2077_04705 [Nitrospirae bacterium GWC2_46_6]|nr:MAG: hypothetical protein A2Z82_02790 [Nitrospirae bacterium GWA2_46_11]OGW21165.1 MAG: hypothetical protein A2077_04705 [Nitrospirae bacterium GWC2_46_6]OGW25731.1 MAG: hypothetical protein A2X55_11525 [Nitrospirae bacterium GWB2_47_37]HAK87981.1 hypothetical protein [Nitrospiraceae bacterium]HCL81295.1 hypothetical protein [Nitrospiraceae bacterium]
MPDMKDFLNPKSMLTPGIAGGLTASVSLTLASAFAISFKWSALGISFLLGLLIMISMRNSIPLLQRFIYCILNSLIVFSMAFGAGKGIDSQPQLDPKIIDKIVNTQLSVVEPQPPSVLALSNAYAQQYPIKSDKPKKSTAPSGTDKKGTGSNESKENNLTKKEMEQLKTYIQQQQNYDKRWSW